MSERQLFPVYKVVLVGYADTEAKAAELAAEQENENGSETVSFAAGAGLDAKFIDPLSEMDEIDDLSILASVHAAQIELTG